MEHSVSCDLNIILYVSTKYKLYRDYFMNDMMGVIKVSLIMTNCGHNSDLESNNSEKV